MSFEFTNVPSTFMRLMNSILHHFLSKFVLVYFQDILVFSHSEEEYLEHLCQVIEALHENELITNLKNCFFLMNRYLFFRFIVSAEDIHVDEKKIEVI